MYKKIGCFLSCLVVFITGCSTTAPHGRPVPIEIAVQDYFINIPRQNVFDAALFVAQVYNLDVALLEKQSGLIRFEKGFLDAFQLDKYCVYPYVNPKTGNAWDTFVNWNKRSLEAGGGSVYGKFSLTILIVEEDSASNVILRSRFIAHNNTVTVPCNSNGEFERKFVNDIKKTFRKSDK